MISPDDLIAGKVYRFEYISATGRKCCILGTFRRTSIEYNVLWYYFEEDIGEIPYEYAALNKLREVLED
jgi:hypothetical protein